MTSATKRAALASLVLAFGLTGGPVPAQNTRWNKLANYPFHQHYPTEETGKRLRDELLFERATQTYLWALAIINTLASR
jgi:hypothetical protein